MAELEPWEIQWLALRAAERQRMFVGRDDRHNGKPHGMMEVTPGYFDAPLDEALPWIRTRARFLARLVKTAVRGMDGDRA